MNKKHLKTWDKLWHDPLLSGIPWSDIEAMLVALGAEISEGNGSRVRIKIHGVRAVFHRPHPEDTTDKGAVKSMRRFLQAAGITEEVVEHDDEAKIFHGEVINTRDVITFEGESANEIEQAFRDSVDDYLAWCKEDGVEPEKPYSGTFTVRISPELHSRVAVAAKKEHVSINKLVENALMKETALVG